MRILLDECVDWRLLRHMAGHDVRTARQMGWSTVKNGELLSLAAAAFDLVVTVDRNLCFQQNVTALPIAVIVLRSRSNRLNDLVALVPALLDAIDQLQPRTLTMVGEIG